MHMSHADQPMATTPSGDAARPSASALRAMLDAVSTAVVLVVPRRDEHGAVTALTLANANAAACAEIGRPLSELIDRPIFSLGTSVLATRSLATYLTALNLPDGESFETEVGGGPGADEPRLRIVRHGDALVCTWWPWNAPDVPADEPQVVDRFRLLAENASDVVYEVDRAGCFTWISPSIEQVLGWIPEPLLGTPAVDLVAVDDIRRIAAQRIAVIEGGTASAVECRFRLPGGVARWMSVDAHALRSDTGEVMGAVVSLHDVDAAVTARQALERSERQLALLADESADVMLQLDLEHRCTWVSAAVERVFGWTTAEVLGHSADEFAHPDDLAAVAQARSGAFEVQSEVTFRYHCADGSYVQVRRRTRPLRDDRGVLIGSVVVLAPTGIIDP
jgi:PAS domain S-box-containing protein